PASRALATMRDDVASSVGPPNIMVPRQIGEIFRPLRPSCRYCMGWVLCVISSFRGDAQHRTRNLEIPRCAIAHLRSGACAPSRNDTHPTKKPPQGLFRNRVHLDQWALAQTFFLVKYRSTVSRIRNTNTCRPSALRASICGSAAHIRNVVTSLAYCATVAGEPSS